LSDEESRKNPEYGTASTLAECPILVTLLTTMQLSLHDTRNWIVWRALFALAIGLVVLVMAGCASSQSGGAVSTREILTAEEISRTTALSAYDAIQIRRPAFLAGAQRRALRDADQPDT
jgi:hypothetical protein